MKHLGVLPIIILLAGCWDDPAERAIRTMEQATSVGKECLRDVEFIRFEYSANCEKLAAAIYPGKVGFPSSGTQLQSLRFASAQWTADSLLWRAYATSLDREAHKSQGRTYTNVRNRALNPGWIRNERKYCLTERPKAECESPPPPPAPEPLP